MTEATTVEGEIHPCSGDKFWVVYSKGEKSIGVHRAPGGEGPGQARHMPPPWASETVIRAFRRQGDSTLSSFSGMWFFRFESALP